MSTSYAPDKKIIQAARKLQQDHPEMQGKLHEVIEAVTNEAENIIGITRDNPLGAVASMGTEQRTASRDLTELLKIVKDVAEGKTINGTDNPETDQLRFIAGGSKAERRRAPALNCLRAMLDWCEEQQHSAGGRDAHSQTAQLLVDMTALVNQMQRDFWSQAKGPQSGRWAS